MKYLNILFRLSLRQALTPNHLPIDYIHFNTIFYTQNWIDNTRYFVQQCLLNITIIQRNTHCSMCYMMLFTLP